VPPDVYTALSNGAGFGGLPGMAAPAGTNGYAVGTPDEFAPPAAVTLPPDADAAAFYTQQARQKVEAVVAETKKKYKREGFTRDREIAFIDNILKICPFCGGVSNWSADNSDGFKFRLRCDSCLGEFYGVPHIKRPEKNKWKVNNVGYFNKSSLAAFQFYTLEEIAKLAAKQE